MKGTETGEKRRLFSSWFYFAGNLEGNHEEKKGERIWKETTTETKEGNQRKNSDKKRGRKEGE